MLFRISRMRASLLVVRQDVVVEDAGAEGVRPS